MKSVARTLALTLPPIRRLYDFAMLHAQGHAESQKQLAESQTQLAEMRQQLVESQSQLASTTASHAGLSKLHESLELQLYVMRSDLQRAAVRNESLSVALGELEAKVAQSRQIAQLCEALTERMNTGFNVVRETSAAASAELSVAFGKLEAKVAQSHQIAQLCESLAERVNNVVRESSAVASAELSVAFGKLAGKMTIMASEGPRSVGGKGQADSSKVARYLDLLEKTLTGMLWNDEPMDPWSKQFDPEIRAIGRDWPKSALTMIGSARLRNFRVLIEAVLAESIPGDILEAGVWRGGACVLARGVLAAHDITDRKVWVADSFKGLPEPDDRYPADAGDKHSSFDVLQVSSQQVRENFRQFDLLDDQVQFLEGWFEDTLPKAPIDALAILRLDGDMYSSTMQTLDALYSKVSVGGYVIVDDYILKGCQQAIHDFRERLGITDPMQDVDGAAIYWKKTRA